MSKTLSSLSVLLALSQAAHALPILGLGGGGTAGLLGGTSGLLGGGPQNGNDLLPGLLGGQDGLAGLSSTLGEALSLVAPATLLCANVAGEFSGLAYALGCTCLGLSNQGILLEVAAIANVAGLEGWVQDQLNLSGVRFAYPANSSPICDGAGGYTCNAGYIKADDGTCAPDDGGFHAPAQLLAHHHSSGTPAIPATTGGSTAAPTPTAFSAPTAVLLQAPPSVPTDNGSNGDSGNNNNGNSGNNNTDNSDDNDHNGGNSDNGNVTDDDSNGGDNNDDDDSDNNGDDDDDNDGGSDGDDSGGFFPGAGLLQFPSNTQSSSDGPTPAATAATTMTATSTATITIPATAYIELITVTETQTSTETTTQTETSTVTSTSTVSVCPNSPQTIQELYFPSSSNSITPYTITATTTATETATATPTPVDPGAINLQYIPGSAPAPTPTPSPTNTATSASQTLQTGPGLANPAFRLGRTKTMPGGATPTCTAGTEWKTTQCCRPDQVETAGQCSCPTGFESILSICVQICTPLLKEAGLCVDALAGLGHTIDGVTGTLGGLGLEGDPVTGLLGGQGLGGGLAGLSF